MLSMTFTVEAMDLLMDEWPTNSTWARWEAFREKLILEWGIEG